MSSRPSAGSRFAIRFVQTYRATAKYEAATSGCLFEPSCSTYALGAYERYGFWRATVRTLRRIHRCRPEYEGSFVDPP
jgi:uncharacterized protein